MKSMQNLSELRYRITFLRELWGYKKVQMADILSISAPYLSEIEYGKKTEISDMLIKLISYTLHVSVRWVKKGFVNSLTGLKLEQARRNPRNRMKAEDVAQKLGVTREFIFAIEEGKIEPSDSFLSKLCVLYGINEFEVRDENIRHVPAHSTTGDSWLDNAITKHRELIDLVEKNPEIEPEIVKLLKGIEAGKNLQKRLGPGESYE